MKGYVLTIFIFLSCSVAGKDVDLAEAVYENPFINGELNPEYDGQFITLTGEVVDIVAGPDDKQLFVLNLHLLDIKPIWVASDPEDASEQISPGDQLIFRGVITMAASLDPSGSLQSMIKSPTLLYVFSIDIPQ